MLWPHASGFRRPEASQSPLARQPRDVRPHYLYCKHLEVNDVLFQHENLCRRLDPSVPAF